MRGFGVWLALGLCFGSAAIADDGQRFRLQIGLVSAPPELFNSVAATLEVDGSVGLRLSFEHLFTKRLGLEVGAATSEHDASLVLSSGVRRTTKFRITPLTILANFHFGDSDRVDPYFGGGLAYVFVGDAGPLGETGRVSVDPELTWTVQYGLDIALGRRQLDQPLPQKWKLGLSVAYLPDAAFYVERTAIPLESFRVSAGVTLRLN